MKLKLTFLICCFLAVTSLSAQSITLFKESFGTQQDHPFPSGWTRANVDNLPYVVGYGVEVFTDAWIALDDQESPTHEIRAFSTSWYESGGTANDWMWTPAIDLSGGNIQLSWQARRFFPGNNSCSYEVRIMTAAPTGTTGNIGNMLSSTVLFSTAGENYALTDRTADLSAYAGQKVYIGFRNTTAVDDILMIDDVTVKTNFAITSPNANTLFSNTAAFSVAENTTVVTTVAATDEAGGNLSYSIAGGADAALFTIDIMTGELSFTDAPDFEAPGDADGNNIYEVTVQATNGTLTDEQTMAVTVTDESGEPINFSGTYLVGDAQPVYKKLSDVAAALNNPANTVTGNVVFELDSDYDGTTGETFPITFNQFNNPLLSTVTIRPKDGVSMRMTAGDPGTNNTLILLDGVDYLQLDGRAGGEGSTINWTIRNKRTAASIGSAIRLQNDATMNRLDYLQLEANPTDASQAVVVLGSTNGSQGNDNNVVSYCNIRNRSDLSPSSIGAGNMVAGILSANTTGVESSFNSGNGFYSNNIFNFFCAADSSFGVNLWSGTTNTSISDNSFYRTNDLTVFGGETFQSAIFVREQLSLGWNVITGNYIGGKAPQATGGRFTLFATQYKFEGITIYSPAQLTAGEANQVYANTIRLIQIGATGHSSGETFCGIKIHNSASYTINNTIGRPDGYESIIVSSSGANSTFTCKGIDYKGLPQSISYNKIGGFKLSSGIGTIAGGFTAINLVDSTASGEFAITDNQIGGNAGYPKSIESNAPQAVAFQVRGIALANEYSSVYCRANAISGIQHGTAAISTIPQPLSGIVKTGNGPASILYNTIAELQASSSEADTSITFPAFTGISVLQGTSNAVGHNTIRELRSVYFSQSAGSAGLAGILVSENASASVYSNYLYGFRSINVYPSFTAVLTGILARGSATISNNTLSFSNRSAEYGSNDLYNCVITGIMAGAPAATLNVYHNSIYIGGDNGEGTNTGWSAPVSMLASSGAPLHLRNNVLVNERTGGNAAHYIFYNAASSPAASWPVTTSDYNLIVALYPDQFGRWGSSNLDSTQWKANGGDAHSTFATIAQIAPSDLFSDKFADLAIQQSAQQYVAGKGITGTGITEDITEAIRSTTAPSLGAYEYEVATLTITSYGGADSAAVNVAENQTAVATVTATHSNPDATITYSLAGGDDDAYFTINDATGELSFVSTPDFWQPSDSDGDNVYLVSVQASDGTLTDVQVIAVTVTDVYEAPPPGITLFQEDFDNITSAFPAGWTLVDVDQMTPSQYIFDLFPNAWNRLPKTSMYPDDPETDTCAWATSWFDYGSNDPADDWMWTPAIDLSGSNIQLSWKAKGAGTYEVRIMTTAPSGSTGNMGNMLSSAVLFSEGIQNFTGVVHSADLSAYSGQKVYIGFRHTSGAGDYVLAIDDVTVKTNFAITSTHTDTIFRNTDAISLPENTTAVTTVAATDETGGSVSYNITGGADAAKFSINNSTGVLSFITAPDFEAPEDAGTNNVYEVTVQATNGTLTDVQTIAVTITDVADAAVLAITSYAGAASATVNVAENQTLVTTVTATYSDPAGVITFSLVGHDDDSYFTVNTTTGELSFVNAPDFERPSDPDENNMYMVTVEASVGGLTAVQRFKVRVTNVNDNAPEFGSFDGDASVTLSIPENTTAVGTVWAVDKEPGTTITYSVLSNNEGALFSINPATGVLRFITAPDYENPADQYRGNVYIVFVQASDGQLNSVQRFKIKVKDVNEGTGRMSNNTTGMAQASGEMQSGKGISIFPNPVTGKRFTLRVTDLSAGNYTLELYTTNGQLACRQTLNHTAKSTSYPIQLPATLTKGMYVLKLAGAGLVHSEKLLID